MGTWGGVALGLVHTRTGSGWRRRARLVQWGYWVDLRLPSCRVQGAEPPSSSLSLKGPGTETAQEPLPEPECRMCGWVRGTGTGRLKAGSGLVERFWGPSPRMDWLDIFIEVAPGPILDQCHLPHPGPDGDRRGHPSGVAFSASLSGTTSDAATPLLRSAWLCSLPTDGLSFLSVASVCKGLGASAPT